MPSRARSLFPGDPVLYCGLSVPVPSAVCRERHLDRLRTWVPSGWSAAYRRHVGQCPAVSDDRDQPDLLHHLYQRISFEDQDPAVCNGCLLLFFLYDSPAGLLFYWTLNNLFSLLKNVFYKLKDPKKVLDYLSAFAGIGLAVFTCDFCLQFS
jgi:hypothetical protein